MREIGTGNGVPGITREGGRDLVDMLNIQHVILLACIDLGNGMGLMKEFVSYFFLS